MENKKKNILIGVMACIIVILIGVCVYLAFFRKNDVKPNIDSNVSENDVKRRDNKNQNKENNVKTLNLFEEVNNDYNDFLSTETYKSNDGKYTLKIIGKNTDEYNKAMNEYKNGYEKKEGKYDNKNVLTYGYLNNAVIEITKVIKEDDTYARLTANYMPNDFEGMCGSTIYIMYNKKTNELEIPVDAEDKFYLCTRDLSFVKINNNYFFLYFYVDAYGAVSAIYNTDWEKIGYISRNNIKYDNEGIYVYEDEELKGNVFKYRFNSDN